MGEGGQPFNPVTEENTDEEIAAYTSVAEFIKDVETSPVVFSGEPPVDFSLPPVDFSNDPPVFSEILEDEGNDILGDEAEAALASEEENTGEENTGDDDGLPSIEFYYGKVKKDGRTIKTGKVYWIFTTYSGGERKRVSPTKFFAGRKKITNINNCPYKGRIFDFYRRSLTFKNTGGSDSSGTGDDGRFSGVENSASG